MKKLFLILQFILLLSIAYSQERFFNLYPGWKANTFIVSENNYILLGSDTLDAGYSNTPILSIIDNYGNHINSFRYVNDTVYGISTYSSKSYNVNSEQIISSAVYLKYNKDYSLNPILLFFNRETFILDSLVNFSNYFNGKSARFMLHNYKDERFLLIGDAQYSTEANIRTFLGIYDPVANTFSYKDYERPDYCIMTPYQIFPASDGGFLLATEQDMTYMDEKVYACILKIDHDGNEMWRYVIQGQTNIPPWGLQAATFRPRIFNSPDGDYYVVWTDPFFNEYINQPNSESTIRIAKLTDHGTYGELKEEKDLRPELDNFASAPYIINDAYQDTDGTMYVLMQTENGYQSALAKIHPNGVGAWMRVYICYPNDDASISSTKLYGISKTEDGGFMLTGAFNSTASSLFPTGMTASIVMKTDSCGCFDAEGCNDHCMDSYAEYFVNMAEASIFPNPASDKITVGFDYAGGETEFEYKIYHINGQLLAEGKSEKIAQTFEVKVDELPSGYYTIQFWGGGKIFTGRFVKE